MDDKLEPLIQDLVAWCAATRRDYAEVLDVWRTSCPRLTVWEEAVDRGLLETRPSDGRLLVVVTDKGRRSIEGLSRRMPVAPRPATAASLA